LIGQVLGAVFSWFYFVKKVQGAGEGLMTNQPFIINKTVLYFCLPIAFTTAFMWVQNQSYRVIVESKMGAETLALLGVGIGVAVSIAGLTESLVTQYFYPQYYSVISKGGPKERLYAWKVLYLNSVAVYVPVTLFVIATAKYILRILVSSKFGDSISLVMMGALIEFFRMMVNILYAVSQSEMRTRETVFPYIVGAVSVIGSLWLLLGSAKPIEIIFIPIVLVIAGILVFWAMYWSMRQILPITLDLSFAFLCVAYSAPFVVLVLIKDVSGSLPMSLSIIGTFGVYLLWAIWRLLRHIEVRKQSL
jgi:O-antigen/teichoic acid export membrane protein